MKVDELIRSLMTYELSLLKFEKKKKGVVLKNCITDHGEHVYSKTDDHVSDSIAMVARNFGRVIRRLEKRTGRNVSSVVRDNQPQQKFQKGVNFQRCGHGNDRSNFNNSNRYNGI